MMLRNYRFTINSEDILDLESGKITVLNKDLLHQIQKVLRLSPESKEEISFIDGSAKVFYSSITELNKNSVVLKINEVRNSHRELTRKIIFLIPVIKLDAFSLMVKMLTELGVSEMLPVAFNRSQKQNIVSLKKDSQRQRLNKIIQEATEQCEGAVFAKLTEVLSLEETLKNLPTNSLRIFASERMADSDCDSNSLVQAKVVEADCVCLLVGPEGGLTDEEVELLVSQGFLGYSLGKRLLKAETASISLFSSLNLSQI